MTRKDRLALRSEIPEVLTSAKGGALFYQMGPVALADRVKIGNSFHQKNPFAYPRGAKKADITDSMKSASNR